MSTIWSEDLKYSPHLELDVVSFNAWSRSCLPQAADLKAVSFAKRHNNMVGLGDKEFFIRTLDGHVQIPRYFHGMSLGSHRACLNTYYGSQKGEVFFDGVAEIPVILEDNQPWMSLTPNEVFTLRAGIKKARGKVLMGGLGLGWMARRVLERKKVKHLTVVEKCPYVIQYFGAPLEKEFGDRLTIIEGDVYKIDPFEFDSALYDIWLHYDDAAYDKTFLTIAIYHPNCWGWGRGWRPKIGNHAHIIKRLKRWHPWMDKAFRKEAA